MLTRRSVNTILASTLALFGGKISAEAAPGETQVTYPNVQPALDNLGHTVFATSRVPNLTWSDVEFPKANLGANFEHPTMSREQMVAEIRAAMLKETVAEIDQRWLSDVRSRSNFRGKWSQTAVAGKHTFIGEVHADLVHMMVREAGMNAETNTAIVSPVGLTIIQSALINPDQGIRFERVESSGSAFGPTRVGTLHSPEKKLQVLCDVYANMDQPILLGNVAEDLTQRQGAIVANGATGLSFGERRDGSWNWDRIDIDSSSMSFI